MSTQRDILVALTVILGVTGCSAEKPAAVLVTRPAPIDVEQAPTAIECNAQAVLRGVVSFEGDPPVAEDLTQQMKDHGDRDCCLQGKDAAKGRSWVVNNGRVANVAVWLRPPKGAYFALQSDELDVPTHVDFMIRHCQLEPRVVVAFAEAFDATRRRMKSTEQQFRITSDSAVNHCFPVFYRGRSPTMYPGLQRGDVRAGELTPSARDPMRVNCAIHQWMGSYLWALDTPFAAVTKEDGSYEIKGVPAGADLMVTFWHEKAGFFHSNGNAGGTRIRLKPGDNVYDVSVKAK